MYPLLSSQLLFLFTTPTIMSDTEELINETCVAFSLSGNNEEKDSFHLYLCAGTKSG